MQEKSERVLGGLKQREVERKLGSQSKKDDKQLAENENVDYFRKTFEEKRGEIEELVNGSENAIDKAEHFNRISNEILVLQKFIAANTLFLPVYYLKKYQEDIMDLTNKSKELENKLLPKKRFGFKMKRNDIKAIGECVVDAPVKIKSKQFINENFCGFKNEESKTLTLLRDEILKKDVTLSNLTNCTVKVYGAPSTLHMSNLKSCKIFTGPVSTSIFANDCCDCTFVISCQQLRLHNSNLVHIYLHVTSRAIMEDCVNIMVAPYNLDYDGIADDYETANLNRKVNNWKSVDDFNWLHLEKQSPNWNILDADKWVTDWSTG